MLQAYSKILNEIENCSRLFLRQPIFCNRTSRQNWPIELEKRGHWLTLYNQRDTLNIFFFLWGLGMMQISLVCYIRNINIHYCGGLLFNNSFCFEGKNNQERSCNYIVLGSARSGSELVWEIRVTPRTHTLCSIINIRMLVWSILIEISILVSN